MVCSGVLLLLAGVVVAEEYPKLPYAWRFPTAFSELSAPTPYQGSVFVSMGDTDLGISQIDKIDSDGTLQWNSPTDAAMKRRIAPVLWLSSKKDLYVYTVASTPSELFALNGSVPKGRDVVPKWKYSEGRGARFTEAAVGEEQVVVGVNTESVRMVVGLDALTGKKKWESTAAGTVSAPAYAHGMVFYTTPAMVRAVDAISGEESWTTKVILGEPTSPPLVDSRFYRVFVGSPTLTGYTILFLHALKGDVKWRVHTETTCPISAMALYQPTTNNTDGVRDLVLFTCGGNLTALNATTGSVVWRVSVDNTKWNLSAPTVEGDTTFVVATTERAQAVWAVRSSSGDVVWTKQLITHCTDENDRRCAAEEVPTPMLVEEGIGYLSGIDYYIYAIPLPSETPSPASPPSDTRYLYFLAAGLGVVAAVIVAFCLSRLCKRGKRCESPSSSSSASVSGPGSRYTVLSRLGSGAFGVVYLVRRKKDGVKFALKYIPCTSDRDREEAMREWKIVNRFQGHPNMIQACETFMNWVSESTSDERQPLTDELANIYQVDGPRYVCIVMPYYSEGDLKQYILSFRFGERVPERVILSYAGQVCSLLSVLHSCQPPLIHRDLKPENLLLADSGRTIVVTDFGLARSIMESYCRTHAGTLAFIAPETWDRHYSTGADIWAVGCIMYAMASRRVERHNCRCLWREASDPAFQQKIHDEVKCLGYTDEVATIIARLLTPDPHKRPSAVQALRWLDPYTPPSSKRHSSTVGSSSKVPPLDAPCNGSHLSASATKIAPSVQNVAASLTRPNSQVSSELSGNSDPDHFMS